eukprot:TRINITY_DN1129_c0_g10_i1.p1 TRINITY_DN1129_c0_g10~~TRINITY_DN1129_c0_g10_i1.p1  ORF type:complete len:646 (+),score=217.16 TRINITY_DN1129_c0_g10_i1:31-1938(+)
MATKVFKDQTFCFSGTLSLKRNEFEALVEKHGGSCGSGVTKKTNFLVTTPAEITTQTAKVVKAQQLSDTCAIVSEDFVNDSIKKKKLQDPSKYSLVGGGKSSSSSNKSAEKPAATSSRKKNTTSSSSSSNSSKVFENLCFCFSGKLSQKRSDLEALVASHGGTFGDGVTKKTTHLVTTQEDFDSKTAKIVKAQSLSTFIVNEDYIHDCIKKKKQLNSGTYVFADADNNDDESEDDESEEDDSEEEEKPTKGKKRKADAPAEKGNRKWILKGMSSSFGIYVDNNICICGDEDGYLLDVDHDTGEIKNKVKLPSGVKAVVRDRGGFLYAGCNDGSVYDCTNLAAPRQMRLGQKNEEREIQWADIYDGNLLINQVRYGCTLLNIEGEELWTCPAPKSTSAWTVRTDGKNAYFSADQVLYAVDFQTGKQLWQKKVFSVTFGVLYDDTMYLSGQGVAGVATSGKSAPVKYGNSYYTACTVDEKHVYGAMSDIDIYDRKTTKHIKTLSMSINGCITSMQIYNNHIYLVTSFGTFECIPLNNAKCKTAEVAFKAAKNEATNIVSAESIEVAPEAKPGEIVCECVKEGGKLRIRPVTAGYNQHWNVQFPTNLRVAGARYVVEELLEAANGGYYRAKGEIKKLA